MPDYNKGDFTQQGIDGFVEGGLHLNEKRCLTAKISTDEETSGIDSIEINIHDHLNDLDYSISGEDLTVGENVIGIIPSGNINITSTAETDVSEYATAQVVDENLVAGNIKKDVEILGITGTFEGGSNSIITTIRPLVTITDFTYVSQDLAYSESLHGWYAPLDTDGGAPMKRIIKFDNVEYDCEYTSDFYGRPISGESYDFSTYPFRIDVNNNMLITQTDGPHTLEISTMYELGTLNVNVVGETQGLSLGINQTTSYNIMCYDDTVPGSHTFLLLGGMTYAYMVGDGSTLSYSDLVGCSYDSDDQTILITDTTASLTVTVTEANNV